MRNLVEHPITREEVLSLLQKESDPGSEIRFGDMKPYIFNQLYQYFKDNGYALTQFLLAAKV